MGGRRRRPIDWASRRAAVAAARKRGRDAVLFGVEAERKARRTVWIAVAAGPSLGAPTFGLGVSMGASAPPPPGAGPPGGLARARATCDAAARTSLETRDPLEPQRADMLARCLDRGVGRRPPDPPPA